MFGNNIKKVTAPESTKTCTSRCTDFQVLPVNKYKGCTFINIPMGFPKIQSKIIRKELHADLMGRVKLEKDKRISLSKRNDIDEE